VARLLSSLVARLPNLVARPPKLGQPKVPLDKSRELLKYQHS
jgi:hypothetical protein